MNRDQLPIVSSNDSLEQRIATAQQYAFDRWHVHRPQLIAEMILMHHRICVRAGNAQMQVYEYVDLCLMRIHLVSRAQPNLAVRGAPQSVFLPSHTQAKKNPTVAQFIERLRQLYASGNGCDEFVCEFLGLLLVFCDVHGLDFDVLLNRTLEQRESAGLDSTNLDLARRRRRARKEREQAVDGEIVGNAS